MMITLLLGIAIQVACLWFLGRPAAAILGRCRSVTEEVFWSCLAGIAFVGLVGATALRLSQPLLPAFALMLVIRVSIGLFQWRRATECIMPRRKRHSATFFVSIGAAILGLSPNIISTTSFSVAFRVGPDAIGNAVAAESLRDGNSIKTIQESAIASTGATSFEEVIDFDQHRLYKSLDLRTQVQTEFLAAGLRWGYPSYLVGFGSFVALSSPWQQMVASLGFSLFLFALGGALLATKLFPRERLSLLVPLLLVASPVLLWSMHEGGYSQIFAMPSVVAFWLVVTEWETSRVFSHEMATMTLILVYMLIFYSDLWLLFAIVSVVFIITSLMTRGLSPGMIQLLGVSFATSLVVALPFSVEFVPYVFRRMADAGIGGWMVKHWPSQASLVGLANSFNQVSPSGLVDRSDLLRTIEMFVNPISAAIVVGVLLVRRGSSDGQLCASAWLVVITLYLKTRFIDDVSNYQVLKAAACLSPMLLLSGTMLFGAPTTINRSRFVKTTRVCLVIMVLLAGANFLVEYRQNSWFASNSEYSDLKSDSIQRIMRDTNIIAPLTLENATMAVSGHANWFGRGAFGVVEGVEPDFERPLALLVRIADCPEWRCLSDVNASLLQKVTPRITLIEVSPTSKPVGELWLRDKSNVRLWELANELSQDISIDETYRPVLGG